MQRERPLQKSMFLPDRVTSPKSTSFEYTFQLTNPHKNSLLQNGHSPSNSLTNQYRSSPNLYLSQIENSGSPVNIKNLQKAISELNEKLESVTKKVDHHDKQLSSFSIKEDMANIVLAEIRQQIPNVGGSSDIVEQLFNVKLDIKAMKEEITEMPKFKDLEALSARLKNAPAGSISPQKINDTVLTTQMLSKYEDNFQKLKDGIEAELTLIKKNIGNMKMDMKVSPISSNSCIMLKYQELFKARNKNETDMVINEFNYYVDDDGFLLDCHSRYIVDQQGRKIRLEEKHLTMLRNQKVLQ